MHVDDSISGFVATLLGTFIVSWSRGYEGVEHIAYGPGFFPALIGLVLIGSGVVLIGRRLLRSRAEGGKVQPLQVGAWSRSSYHVGALVLIPATTLFYILVATSLGFLLTMPVILFVLVWWLDRSLLRALAVAVLGTLFLHTFFQVFMTVPLPWGVLEPWAGTLTWM